jgi:hypothetical protein
MGENDEKEIDGMLYRIFAGAVADGSCIGGIQCISGRAGNCGLL